MGEVQVAENVGACKDIAVEHKGRPPFTRMIAASASLPGGPAGFAVGQREQLTVRLAGLIRQYPRGPGIIKEFIQNADDAGARSVRVVMDWRDRRPMVQDPRLRHMLGPALLIGNDGTFSDEDFGSILRIGDSGKKAANAKTGRFGLGFNTAYNVTDHPSLLSRDRLFCLDPHGDAVSAAQGDGGRGYLLSELPVVHPGWLETFEVAGLGRGAAHHDGTLFRLPLRDAERASISEISAEPFRQEDFQAIAQSLLQDGPAMLLFTRNVTDLLVEEVSADGESTRRVLSIRTENRAEVKASRDAVHGRADGTLAQLAGRWLEVGGAPRSRHRHMMVVEADGREAISAWHVTIGFYPDAEGRLLAQGQSLVDAGEKAVPEVGVAVALYQDSDGRWRPGATAGRLCCGLPLPMASSLPAYVNGCFDLDAARTGITIDAATLGMAQERLVWNRLLMNLAVPVAYADAVVSLSEDLGRDGGKSYELWPDLQRISPGLLRDAAVEIHRALADRPLFACRDGKGVERRRLPLLALLPDDAETELSDALAAEGFHLAAPALPAHVIHGAELAGLKLMRITPAQLAQRWRSAGGTDCDLADAPHPALRRPDWVEAVVRYLMRGSPPVTDIAGLPLCLLSNGRLATFGHASSRVTFIGSDVQRSIFASQQAWFVDPGFYERTGLRPQADAKFLEMSPAAVLINLRSVIPKASSTKMFSAGQGVPHDAWLTEVLRYLVNHADVIDVGEVVKFPLVPDQGGVAHLAGTTGTPLLRPSSPRLNAALETLGIPLVSGSVPLVEQVRAFATAFGKPIVWPADGPDLADTLVACADAVNEALRTDPASLCEVLGCLSRPECLDELDEDQFEALRGLCIVPTIDGGVATAADNDLFLSSGEAPPAVAGTVRLVDGGPGRRWETFFERLGIERLDVRAVIQEVLLPAYLHESVTGRLESIRYIRDNLLRAQAQAGADASAFDASLRSAMLVAAEDGTYLSAAALYDPACTEAGGLLGDAVRYPDMRLYRSEAASWLDFFRRLGLKTQVSAADLLDRVDTLTGASVDGPHTRAGVAHVFGWLQRHWSEMKDARVGPGRGTLAEELRRRAWLPSLEHGKGFPGFEPPGRDYYSPEHIYPRSLGHLVASQAALLDASPAGAMMAELGVPPQPPPALVLAHFDRLLELWNGPSRASVNPQEIETSLKEIYRYLGRAARPSGRAMPGLPDIDSRYKGVSAIWDAPRRRLVRPEDAFAERVPFFEPFKVYIAGDPPVQAGLDALGRRARPELEDFVDFLRLLAADRAGMPCTEPERRQALNAYARIADELIDEPPPADLPMLTTLGCLVPAPETFRDDVPHLAQRVDLSILPIVDPKIATRIQSLAPRLSICIEETLEGEPELSHDQQLGLACARIEATLQAPAFLEGLMRLVHRDHGWSAEGFVPPITDLGALPALGIETSLWVRRGTDREAIGGGRVPIFLDRNSRMFWVATSRVSKLMYELSVRINDLLGSFRISDTGALEAIVGARHEDIAELLDDRGVPRLVPASADIYVWDLDPEEAAAGDAVSSPPHDDDAPLLDFEPQDGFPPVSSPASPLESESQATRRERSIGSIAMRNVTRPTDGTRGTPEPRPSLNRMPSPPGPVSGRSDSPPLRPGHGQPANNPTPRDGGRSGAQARRDGAPRGRFVTYVAREAVDEAATDTDRDGDERQGVVGKAAVLRVLAFERGCGRLPVEMDHSNPGFDVQSTDPDGRVRYIEVKGTEGSWPEAGVGVSRTQFHFALAQAGDAWLYVVEHACAPDAIVHPIHNPSNMVTYFYFDPGWREVAGRAEQSPHPASVPPVIGEEFIMDGGEVGTVAAVREHGALTSLTVRLVDGTSRRVIWRPVSPADPL